MITLENWFVSYDGIGYTANGVVYGHSSPHCLDGTEIHTSLIESAEVQENEIILFTLNSEYHVFIDEMDCDCFDPWRSLRIFERFARHYDIEECLPVVRERFLTIEKELLQLKQDIYARLPDNALYLELSDDCEFYFRLGMFKSAAGTEEFLPRITDFDTEKGKLIAIINYAVEYYPYNGGNIEFISHSETTMPDGEHLGIIRNSGSSALNIKFSWGNTVILAPDSELEIICGMGGPLPLTCTTQDF
ncbi:MAG: hypothetical protein ACI4WS_14400 [Oscillospiraceae bacterium]